MQQRLYFKNSLECTCQADHQRTTFPKFLVKPTKVTPHQTDQLPTKMDNRRRPPAKGNPTVGRVIEARGVTRQPCYFDDETINKMIESFGPMEYSEFAATQEKILADQRLKDLQEQASKAATGPSPMKESILKWFDKSVEKELTKRRDAAQLDAPTLVVDPALCQKKAQVLHQFSKGTKERMAEVSASRIEIAHQLETDVVTELTDAVEKFAKAEQMCAYQDALQAAETAAQNAPPELAEVMAAAEARKYQTEIKTVKRVVGKNRPIEVVGYVGITKPEVPKKSSCMTNTCGCPT